LLKRMALYTIAVVVAVIHKAADIVVAATN
jgi:hypothetical protein